MTIESCETCRFFGPRVDLGFGQFANICRRHPPAVMPRPTRKFESAFPSTEASAWCGEHRKAGDD